MWISCFISGDYYKEKKRFMKLVDKLIREDERHLLISFIFLPVIEFCKKIKINNHDTNMSV